MSAGGDLRPGVILDVDGTLLDTNYLHTVSWWRALRDAGHSDVQMSDIHRSVGIASEGLVRRLIGRTDERAIELHSQYYAELRDEVTAFPKAAELVQTCQRRGLVTVLATSGKKDDLDWMLPAIGVEDAFEGYTTSSEVEEGKPSGDLFGVSIERHSLDPARTVAVGDTVWDVQAAEQAGLQSIAVCSGGISEPELRDAGAAEVYDDVAALLEAFDDSLLARLAQQ